MIKDSSPDEVVSQAKPSLSAGIPKDALRWIPSHDMRYVAPEPGAEPGGSSLASDRLIDWVEAMNRFLHEGLQSHRAQPLFCHSETRARGGEAGTGKEGVLVKKETVEHFSMLFCCKLQTRSSRRDEA